MNESFITVSALSSLPGVRHGFFTRNHPGERRGEHNCAYRTGDDTAAVDANRAFCARSVGCALERLVTVKQRHTADVFVADQPVTWKDAPVADAIVTTRPELALGILTADCVPVLLADDQGRVIAAAHAGWRGAFEGVLENTLDAMEKLGAARGRIIAAVGPCIGKTSYEVGPEFAARFTQRDPDFAAYFSNHRPDGHCYFDIAAFVADRLRAGGVSQVAVTGHDTCAQEDVFFSYRRAVLRQEPDYGRQMSVIAMIKP